MKYRFAPYAALLLGMICFQVSYSQSKNDDVSYKLEVNSTDPPAIDFHGSYALYIPNEKSALITIKKTTPFQMTLTGTQIMGMFQANSDKSALRVTLTQYQDNAVTGRVEGSSSVNIVYGGPETIGYGIPSNFGHMSSLFDPSGIHQQDGQK